MNETKIISVTNDKGGVGKTTTVHNFGYALMKKGYRVLLVDFNAQCDLTAELGIAEPDAENNTLCDAMRPYIMDTDGFLDTAECIRENPNGLDFLPATQELADLETLMIQAYQREMILSSILQEISGQYDFILIDCPGSLGQLMVNALMASNEVILAAFPEKNSLAGLNSVYTRSGQNSTPNSNATNLHSSQKRCCSFCISSSNASPAFQVQKSIFHQMTTPIQVTVILPLLLAISLSWNDDIHSSISGISNDLIGVIPTIGQ